MILGGDEFRRTQQGNSNAYCQDNELSWFDWGLIERNSDLVRFVRGLIAIRQRHPSLRSDRFYGDADLTWFDCDGRAPDWESPALTLGVVVHVAQEPETPELCLLFNPSGDPAVFDIPSPVDDGGWQVLVDTGRRLPNDLPPPRTSSAPDARHRLAARTMALLCADRPRREGPDPTPSQKQNPRSSE